MDIKYASKEKQEIHDKKLAELYSALNVLEKETYQKLNDWGLVYKDSTYGDAFQKWQTLRNSCPECHSDKVTLLNYDMKWHNGDIVCSLCGTYVRGYDAG